MEQLSEKINVCQRDVMLLPYPFSNQEKSKVRPAVVVSNNIINNTSADFIAIPLTTVLKDEPYSVNINQENMVSGKLLKQSRARADKIFCVEKRLVIMKIGSITAPTFDKIKNEIFRTF